MKDFIDLGKKYGGLESESPANTSKMPKIEYPTLYITHKDGDETKAMDEMEDEGEAVIKYKLKRYSEDIENGSCSCELSVISIKPLNKKEKKKVTSEESLDGALEKIVERKKK